MPLLSISLCAATQTMGRTQRSQMLLCEKYYTEKNIRDPPDTVESVGHIQCYCPVLQLPRIAIHHGIWRKLMFSIRKSSTELNDASEPRWHFPSALSPEAHAEWGLYKILEYMGLHEILPPGAGQNRAKLRKDIEEYHTAYAIDFDDMRKHLGGCSDWVE